MKVLLRQNISQLGKIGDVVDVKRGYARNHLLPKGLAAEPTKANIKAIEAGKQRYLEELAVKRGHVEARAMLLRGREVTIAARANEEGALYGSIGAGQIIEALGEHSVGITPESIELPSPIRRLDKYDVQINLGQDVTATIHVWIVPIREDGEGEEAGEEAGEEPGEGPGEKPTEQDLSESTEPTKPTDAPEATPDAPPAPGDETDPPQQG